MMSERLRESIKRFLVACRVYGIVPRVARIGERLDPSLRLGLRNLPEAPPVALAGVYRARNEAHVERMLAALPSGSKVALWALDDITEGLAALTVGSGPGTRFDLLNRCVAELPLLAEDWLIISDDDVAFRRGDATSAVRLALACGLDLAQPAHTWASHRNWNYTRRRFLTIARRGQFVEIGPTFLVSPKGRRLVLPFPEGPGMGWGTEAIWASLQDHGLRMGILDAILIEHLVPMGTGYDAKAEHERERELVDHYQLGDLRNLQHDVARWHAWRPLRSREPARDILE